MMRSGFAGIVVVGLGLTGCGGDQAPEPGSARESLGQIDSIEGGIIPDSMRRDSMLPPGAILPGTSASGGAMAGGAPGQVPAGSAGPGSSSPGQLTPVAPGAPLPTPVGTAANDILTRAEQTYAGVRSMEADFTQQVYVPLLNSTQNSRGKIYHRAPDRFLMRFSDPEGDVVVADGRYVWMYYPSTDERQVMRGALGDGQSVDLQREFLSNSAEKYVATRTGAETVGGRETHALTLIPRGASPYRQIKVWIDAQDNLVRRFEIIETNGTMRRLEMSNLRPNVTLANDLFEFTPPPGAQIYEP
jgi:outer membrane lipoprotein carrier protein